MVHINLTPTPRHLDMIQILPPKNATHIVTPAVNSTNAGMEFQQSVLRRNNNVSADDKITLGNDSGMIYMLNDCPFNG